MKPINKIPRLIRIATAVIVVGGLAVMVLSAQDNLDTVRQAAEQGDAAAQFSLGFMYHEGKGVLKDDAEAVRWYRLAAEQGIAAAQFNLGLMYSEGEGVRTMPKPCAGIGWLPSKVSPQHSSTSGSCTPRVRVSSRTMPKP